MRTVRFSDPSGDARIGKWTEDGIVADGNTYDSDEVSILPPTEPTKIICQAGGYMDHREESGFEDRPERPELFIKTPNCVVGDGDAIELSPDCDVVEFDASFSMGPAVTTPDEVPEDATLALRLNGETKQETTREMLLFSVPKLVVEITELITPEAGDIIATGAPFGPDELSEGDTVEVEFDGVGVLMNHVKTC